MAGAGLLVVLGACGRIGFAVEGSSDGRPTDDDATVLLPAFLRYTFEEGSGSVVVDRGAGGAMVDLTIVDPAAAQWQADGLRLTGTGLAGGVPTTFYTAVAASQGVTIEAWVVPDAAAPAAPTPRRIVTSSVDLSGPNIMLGQGDDGGAGGALWTVRVATSADPFSVLETPAGTATAQRLAHLVYTYDAFRETIWVDAAIASLRTVTGGLGWDPSFPLTVGDERIGGRGFDGLLRRVALYDRALSDAEVAMRFAAGPPGPE